MIETVAAEIVYVLFNFAHVIEGEVHIIGQFERLHDLCSIEIIEDISDMVDLLNCGSIDAFVLKVPIIVLVEASVPSLKRSSKSLHVIVEPPHLLEFYEVLSRSFDTIVF